MTAQEFKEEYESGAYVEVHTSGSTGKPKNISLAKEFMRLSAERSNRFFGISRGNRIHSCVAFDYIGGKMTLVRSLEAGAYLTAETPSNRPTLKGEIVIGNDTVLLNTPIDLLSVVPSQMPWLIAHRNELPEVRHYLIGGSQIPPAIRKEISEAGINAWESYGMTETASHVALRKVEQEDTIPFRTLPGITVEKDERGCLIININTGSDTIEKFITNDIAIIISETEFRLIGRYDNVINTGGKKFYPEEAERNLAKATDRPLMFTSRPDSKWGEAIVMLIERKPGCDDQDIINEIKRTINNGFLPWQHPKEIIMVDSLPRTSNGKFKRKIFGESGIML